MYMTNRIFLRYTIDMGLLISFLVCTITGIFKFPAITNSFKPVFRVIPATLMMLIHDWSGAVLVLFVLFHLILNWQWMITITKSFFEVKE